MKVIKCPAGILKANCYIVFDEDTKEGIVVDPGGDADKILDICRENETDIKYIVLTHGHGDHAAGVVDIKAATNAQILMNKADDFLIHGGNQRLIPILRKMKLFDADQNIEDGDIIKLNGFELEIIATPGHTPGGVCIKIGDMIFSGDTLFKGSVGRTDFELGSMDMLIASIKDKLCRLPDETIVYPGHEGSTTIGNEKKFNPFF
jgi:hydroxyacylglutathione hydrolase